MSIGIYKITNIVNNKIYVGSTTTSFKIRKNHHIHSLRKNVHTNKYLQNSWNKHGELNFKFEIIEECIPIECINRETYWCNYYNSLNSKFGYNIEIPLIGALGVKRSQETKDKISAKLKGIKRTDTFKARLSEIWKGRIISEKKNKKILSFVHKGKILSQETKNKISKNSPKIRPWKNKKINQYYKNMNFIKSWNSIKECCKELKIKNSSISNCLKKLSKSAGGFKWEYAN